MKSVYVATQLANVNSAKRLIARFKAAHISVTYDWTSHGKVTAIEDLTTYGLCESEGVIQCDLLFLILPGGGGAHFEAGMAFALGKPIVVLQQTEVEQKTFYYLPGVYRHTTEDQAFSLALELLRDK